MAGGQTGKVGVSAQPPVKTEPWRAKEHVTILHQRTEAKTVVGQAKRRSPVTRGKLVQV